MGTRVWVAVVGTALTFLSVAAVAQAQAAGDKAMMKPKMEVVSGVLADMTCAAKGQAMGIEQNATSDTHMMGPGQQQEKCATMCLKGGQPAGLYADGKIVATLLADPSKNLYKFAAQKVDIEGYWAGKPENDVKTFVPARIRLSGTKDWTEVKTGQMH